MEYVDKGLIKLMLSMTPEQRLDYNTRTIKTVLEMRHAVKKASSTEPGKADRESRKRRD